MKRISLNGLQKIFTAILLTFLLGFAGFVAYLGLTYGSYLSGNIASRGDADLLSHFSASRFDAAVARLNRRRSLPDPDPALPDPFGLIK